MHLAYPAPPGIAGRRFFARAGDACAGDVRARPASCRDAADGRAAVRCPH